MDTTESAKPKATEDTEIDLKSVDLRPFLQKWGLDARVQGGRDTCSVFALTASIEYAMASKQQRGTQLSVEFLNWAANQRDDSSADGANFSDLWKGYEAYGICPETEMPYQEHFDACLKANERAIACANENLFLGLKLHWIKKWDATKGINDEQLAEIKRVLQRRWPVCGGFLWPKQERYDDGVLFVPSRQAVLDGHSVLLIGYRDDEQQPGGGVFLFRNIAGESRDSSMTYDYARLYLNDVVWIDYDGANEGGDASARTPPVARAHLSKIYRSMYYGR